MKIIFALLSILLLASEVSPAAVPESEETYYGEDQDPYSITTPSPSLFSRVRSHIAYVIGLGSLVAPKTKEILRVYHENKDELSDSLKNLQSVVKDQIMKSGGELVQRSSELARKLQEVGNRLKEAIFENVTPSSQEE